MPWTKSTAGPCECDWFENAAAEPNIPIVFNERLNEYNLVFDSAGGSASMPLYFCPFCGGAAPKSRRDELFARITTLELNRLQAVTSGLHTVEDVIRELGPPDHDLAAGEGAISAPKGHIPPMAQHFRMLVYSRLSETIDIRVTDRDEGRVRFTFTGKYIGSPDEQPNRPPPRSFILATCQSRPDLTPSDQILADALRSRGASARAAPWDTLAPDRLENAVVCLRSTWDYYQRSTEFRRWIEGFRSQSESLWNPPGTALWNLDKIYLRQLEAGGVPIPPTHWIEPEVPVDLPALLAGTGWDRAVLKPRVSAGAHGTYLVTPTTPLTHAEREPLLHCGALLQELVPEVQSRGEISLVFIDGDFSHAIRKRTATGEFRVQQDFGGSATLTEVGPTLRDFGAQVLRVAALPWIYARVDVVEAAAGPLLMELELIEPDLFFTLAPVAADRLAGALIAHASTRSSLNIAPSRVAT